MTFREANLPKACFLCLNLPWLRSRLTVRAHWRTDNTDMYLSSPVFVAINPFRLSFSRVHSRLWHTPTSANGLQSVPKDWICIISLFRGNSASQAPFDSPQNAAQFKQESSTGFLSNVLATFLFRGDNLRRVFGWSSQLRLLRLMEIRAWQLPGDKLETYCHSSLIQFFLHSKWLLSFPSISSWVKSK